MGYAAIMVHVDADADSDKRVRLALELAERWNATLIGAGAWALQSAGAGDIAGGEDHGSGGGDIVDGDEPDKAQIEEISAWLGRLGDHFRSSAQSSKPAVEWRSAVDYPTEFVIREAHAADLVIVGPDRTGDSYRSLDPGAAIVRAGRPVLLVPGGIDSLKARRIIIGWKDTREARRAVRDSLPFLRKADEVLAVHVAEKGPQFAVSSNPEDVANYLSRHGIRIQTRIAAHSKTGIGGELIRSAKERGADLIVAGGYGHSRLGELVFGGMTRDLIAASPVCCLLSH
jgi:nucleotide-binding universal stress UspA family protein